MVETTWRLEPEQVGGRGWRVVLATGNRKRGTKQIIPVTDPTYTLAQAQAYCSNNRSADFAHLMTGDAP